MGWVWVSIPCPIMFSTQWYPFICAFTNKVFISNWKNLHKGWLGSQFGDVLGTLSAFRYKAWLCHTSICFSPPRYSDHSWCPSLSFCMTYKCSCAVQYRGSFQTAWGTQIEKDPSMILDWNTSTACLFLHSIHGWHGWPGWTCDVTRHKFVGSTPGSWLARGFCFHHHHYY